MKRFLCMFFICFFSFYSQNFCSQVVMAQNYQYCHYIGNNNYQMLLSTGTERKYMVNVQNLAELMEWPINSGNYSAMDNDLPAAEITFIQAATVAADRWSDAGSGTLVYYGVTNVPTLQDLYSSDPTTCSQIPILVTIDTTPNALFSAQVIPRCKIVVGGVTYAAAAELKVYVYNGTIANPIKIQWNFDTLTDVLLHEFGHVKGLEHTFLSDYFDPGIYATMAYDIYATNRLTEWDVKCARYVGTPRSYKTYARNITSSGIGSEYEITPANKTENFASGCYKQTNTWIPTMVYEDNQYNQFRWFRNVTLNTDSSQIQTLSTGATNEDVVMPSFQIWREQGDLRKKYLWSIVNTTGSWDKSWRVSLRPSDSNGNWLNTILDLEKPPFSLTNPTFIKSEFPPSIAWNSSAQKSVFVWNEIENSQTYIGHGVLSSPSQDNYIENVKILQPSGIKKTIPPSVVCGLVNSAQKCIVVYVTSDSGGATHTWKDKNVIKIGHAPWSSITHPTLIQVDLTNVHELPSVLGIKMRTSKQPVAFFDGSKFWIIFRGSYWPGQRLTAFSSTDGLNWTSSSAFDSMPFGNIPSGGTSYSAVAPSIPSYVPGCGQLIYSRP